MPTTGVSCADSEQESGLGFMRNGQGNIIFGYVPMLKSLLCLFPIIRLLCTKSKTLKSISVLKMVSPKNQIISSLNEQIIMYCIEIMDYNLIIENTSIDRSIFKRFPISKMMFCSVKFKVEIH